MEGCQPVTGSHDVLDAFTAAAVEWAAGGRGKPLVDAAARALADGLDSPTLRVLAGAPRATAEDEATELAPAVFQELGIPIHGRLTTAAIVEAARQRAALFLAHDGRPPRDLARQIYGMCVSAGYPDELAEWAGFDDWYGMLEDGVMTGRVADVDAAVTDAARALAEG
jgi:hypothetical protein